MEGTDIHSWFDPSDEDAPLVLDMEGRESDPAIAVHGACGSTENPSFFPPQPMEGADVPSWSDRSDGNVHF